MAPGPIDPIPDVAEVTIVRGALAGSAAPTLLFEVPHGATRRSHYDRTRDVLRGDYPDDLRDFFFVNTDVGSPEVALAAAERFVGQRPHAAALVVRCLVPRTFVDCNRVIDLDAAPRASAAGEPTPGLHVYVRHPDDRRLLLARYAAYRDLATAAYERVCGDAGGLALMVHSFAPRSIDVPVDERIVERLRAEYRPERIGQWPLRAQVDLITTEPDGGRDLASPQLAAHVERTFAEAGFEVARNRTYELHPVSLAHRFGARHEGRTLCLELRRDLLVREFTPFAEMIPDPDRTARAAGALAAAAAAAAAAGPPGGAPPQSAGEARPDLDTGRGAQPRPETGR